MSFFPAIFWPMGSLHYDPIRMPKEMWLRSRNFGAGGDGSSFETRPTRRRLRTAKITY